MGSSIELRRSFYLESKRVDFLSLLGEKTGHSLVVSKILGYLSCTDLQNVSKVSKTWQKLCLGDKAAALRVKQFKAKRKMLKENQWVRVLVDQQDSRGFFITLLRARSMRTLEAHAINFNKLIISSILVLQFDAAL